MVLVATAWPSVFPTDRVKGVNCKITGESIYKSSVKTVRAVGVRGFEVLAVGMFVLVVGKGFDASCWSV